MNIVYKIFLILLFLIPVFVFAHPGNTASDGAHYCRTNCDYWGVPWGARHSHGGSSYSSSYSDYSYSSTPSCPSNSYSIGSSCKCNYGYIVSGGECISGNSYCYDQLGIMSTYDSLNNSCKCMYGYEIGSYGLCTYKPTYSSSYNSSYSSNTSCPAHSSESTIDSSKCSCDAGYETDKAKTKCVKISKRTNDKACRVDFGSKSEWTGKYDDEGEPYCGCKKKYEWDTDQTSCVKSK